MSGPSGAGKSALSASVIRSVPDLVFSVSFTTRAPRGGEREGTDYYFVSRAEFDALAAKGAFLEWAEVYGNRYGTSNEQVEAELARGRDVLLDIDVQGAGSVRARRPDAASVFIMPPSYRVLRERLERRNLDENYMIEKRLRTACEEIAHFKDYDYLIINDQLDSSIAELKAIITGSRCRMTARAESAESIVATFGGLDAEDP